MVTANIVQDTAELLQLPLICTHCG